MLRRGLRASSPIGAAASKPMKARMANTIPLNTPLHSPVAWLGLNGCRFTSPALEISIQIARPPKMAISNAPRITPAVVEIAEDGDLERAQDHARGRGDADGAVGEQ